MKFVISFIAVLCIFATAKADEFGWGENVPDLQDWEVTQAEDAGAPKPCCTPSQWEGNMGEFTSYYSYRHHRPGLVSLGARLSYDGKGKRVAVTAGVPKRPPVQVIMDFSKNKTFMIFPTKKYCKVSTNRRPFRPACLPKSAKLVGSFFQGAGSAKVNENSWAWQAHGFYVTTTVTRTGCIPIGEWVFGKSRGTLVASSLGFVNITAGIKNPKVFTPPSYCKSVDEDDMNLGEEYPILEYIKYKYMEE